jgi:hypothetical protein
MNMSRRPIDDSKARSKRERNSEQVSLGKIIDTLTPSQVWTLISIVFMVLSGAFALGYKLKSSIAQSEIASIQVEVSSLKTELKELREKSDALFITNQELTIKERFLTFYIRYIDAKEASEKSPSNQRLIKKRREAADFLITFIKEQLSRSSSKDVSNRIPVMRVGIGRTPNESVVILNDGTQWSIPPEIAASFDLRSCFICP